jgi:hypothetical protein
MGQPRSNLPLSRRAKSQIRAPATLAVLSNTSKHNQSPPGNLLRSSGQVDCFDFCVEAWPYHRICKARPLPKVPELRMADWLFTALDFLVGFAFLGLAAVACLRASRAVPTCTQSWGRALATCCCEGIECCGMRCLPKGGVDGRRNLLGEEQEGESRASRRAARFQIPVMIAFGSLLRFFALLINDRNFPASFDP